MRALKLTRSIAYTLHAIDTADFIDKKGNKILEAL